MNNLQVKHELFRRGNLQWLLYEHQKPIYHKIREVIADPDPTVNSHMLDISRQYGKSFTMFLIAVEECLRQPKHTVVFVAPEKGMAIEIVTQSTFDTIFQFAPEELIPKLHDNKELTFQNGSRIRLSGSDNKHYRSLRGGKAHLILLDEAGFMADLSDGVLPSVEPMLKTTRGKVIYASTPPENLDHDYEDIYRNHKEINQVTTFTIYDDKQATPQDIQRYINICHGEHTTKFKREYLCQHVSEQSKQVVPELTPEKYEKSLLLNDDYTANTLYPFWQRYVVLDWGGRDKTAVLFAHYNFRTKEYIIEDHLDLVGYEINLSQIATRIKEKTKELWGNYQLVMPIMYYCDNNNVLAAQEMNTVHNLPFIATTKGGLDAMVQRVKEWVYDDRIKFSKKAEFALKSVQSAHWVSTREKFAQSKTFGHYDHLAALVYAIRNIDEFRDPVPMLNSVSDTNHFINPELRKQNQQQVALASQLFINPRKGMSFRK